MHSFGFSALKEFLLVFLTNLVALFIASDDPHTWYSHRLGIAFLTSEKKTWGSCFEGFLLFYNFGIMSFGQPNGTNMNTLPVSIILIARTIILDYL